MNCRNLVASIIRFLSVFLLTVASLKAEEKDYNYTGIDGNKHVIKAFFPEGHQASDQRPFCIYFHGGGWKSGDLKQGNGLCEYLASRGIVA